MPILLTEEIFAEEVHKMAQAGVPYLDAIMKFCYLKGIEPETAAELVEKNPLIRSRLLLEAESLSLIKKESRLPF